MRSPTTESPPTLWLRFVKSALQLFATTSIQGAVSLTVGGIAATIALAAGETIYRAPAYFVAAMALPLWPLRIYFAPQRIFERKAKELNQFRNKGLITKAQRAEAMRELYAWYRREMKIDNQRQLPVPESDDDEQQALSDE